MLIAALVLAVAAGLFLGAGPPLLAELLDGGKDAQAGRTAPEVAAVFICERSRL